VLKVKLLKCSHYQLLCDFSTSSPRPLVPASLRKAVFAAIHGVAHPGIRATKRLISGRFVWPKMSADIGAWCKDCVHCNVSKVTTHVRAAVTPIDLLPRRFAHLHVNLVGPFPVSAAGNRYLFTVIDRSTRWVEAVPVPDMSTGTCAAALFSGWIGHYGVPDLLTSDRGAQFTSEMWAAVCRRLDITHNMTTAYHPQSNGLVERFHRQLKEALRARLAAAAADREFHLPRVLLGIRAAPKDDSNISAAEAVFGQALLLPGQLLAAGTAAADQPALPEALRSDLPVFVPLPLRGRSYAAVEENVPEALKKAEFVYICRDGVSLALSSRYEGPYKGVSTSPKLFWVMIGGKSWPRLGGGVLWRLEILRKCASKKCINLCN
jgi:Integrase zinc binding domain/Integrase core domain